MLYKCYVYCYIYSTRKYARSKASICIYQVRVCAHCAAFIAKKEVPPLRLVAFVAIDDRAVALAAATTLADQVGPESH